MLKFILIFISLNAIAIESLNLNLKSFLAKYLSESKNIESKKLAVLLNNEKISETNSQFLPTASALGTSSKTDKLNGDVDRGISNAVRTQTSLKLTQNIFNGFRDSEYKSYYTLLKEKLNLDLQGGTLTEVLNSVDLYFSYLKAEKDLENINKEIESNARSLSEIKKNLSSGNARRTQYISLQSTIATNRVELKLAESNIKNILIKIKIALNLNDADLKLDTPKGIRNVEPIEVERILKMENRPDYKASVENTKAVQKLVDVTKAIRLPTVDLSGSYYLSDNSQTLPLKNYYAAQLTLSIPFPFGNESRAKIEESLINYRSSVLEESVTKQNLSRERELLIEDYQSEIENIKALEESEKLAKENVDYLNRDYKSGLNSYSDFINAGTLHLQTLRKLDQSKINLELLKIKILVWSGDLTEILK